MSAGRIRLSVDDARSLGERAMHGIGYDAEEARIVTDHVIDAALCGYEYSGLAKLLNISEHRRFGLPRQHDKSGLKSVLGVIEIAENTPADGEDQRTMALGESGKCGLVV